LDLSDLQKQLNGKSVVLYYADHWTPLDPKGRSRHITRLEFENQVLYNEIVDRFGKRID
ncbi:MAG: hypothetical protein JJ975_04340, partial [Bacteroidia bacterium]|nr:hypothetical protein [Bacteroidia bacterium]